jgi:S-adenosyl-L-methionine hydrolase (adenosine-forming)
MTPVVTILTDFVTVDGYVAQMKGVILSIAPGAQLVDITHDIPPQDVETARLTLARYWRRFPPGTVHLAVVDPGVGSSRASLGVRSDGRVLIGPDNGVLSPALLLPGAEVVSLPVPASAAPTFHGRDVFAPAAAAVLLGAAVSSLGASFTEPVVRRTPEPLRQADGSIAGQVIAIDRFGNAITNLLPVFSHSIVEIAGHSLEIVRTYSDASTGTPCAVVGSSGFVEVSVRDGNAAAELSLSRGAPVQLRAR